MNEREIQARLDHFEKAGRIAPTDRNYWKAMFSLNSEAAELALSGQTPASRTYQIVLTHDDERVLQAMSPLVTREAFVAERAREISERRRR